MLKLFVKVMVITTLCLEWHIGQYYAKLKADCEFYETWSGQKDNYILENDILSPTSLQNVIDLYLIELV